ncbi:STM4012 family radical SAM protein [Limibacter armeniacum]|uniref:STM4012 family radical SAM protein n=1 Tax=Limibacter armeniacum TaxID=466084 RepID=UPI002FE6115E
MRLKELIEDRAYYNGYAYSYPHKMAYRPFATPKSLKALWKDELKRNLFLYVHIPFCEMRCGFCNLFTVANPKAEIQNPFLTALFSQMEASREALGDDFNFSNFALGGGTPTYLSAEELTLLFDRTKTLLNVDTRQTNSAIEVSPKTITDDKIALLKERGMFRVSMGVQSMIEAEVKAMGRPQKLDEVKRAIEALKAADFPLLNFDLIYGAENQTKESWQYSLKTMVDIAPEEIFLYPLYVRPLTGLGKQGKDWDDFRFQLYQQGRDFLMENGYRQLSMRQFKKETAPDFMHPDYKTHKDGMMGLGAGARSYTEFTHYSHDYAVGSKGVKQIIHNYNQSTKADFETVKYGFNLNLEEKKRRFVIKCLCEGAGLSYQEYQQLFGELPIVDFPQLQELIDLNLVEESTTHLQLNKEGKSLEDVIGPWLYSEAVEEAMGKFELS